MPRVTLSPTLSTVRACVLALSRLGRVSSGRPDSDLAFCYQACEVGKGAIVRALGFRRKGAGGQFPIFQMVGDTVATDAHAGATSPSAVAAGEVWIFFAVHVGGHLSRGRSDVLVSGRQSELGYRRGDISVNRLE